AVFMTFVGDDTAAQNDSRSFGQPLLQLAIEGDEVALVAVECQRQNPRPEFVLAHLMSIFWCSFSHLLPNSDNNLTIRVGISATRILTWALYASLPLACHVLRRILSGRDQFHCRGWDADHLPRPHLARSRRESCQRHQHSRSVAGTVRRTVWLSKRAREQLDYSVPSRPYQRPGRRARSMVADLDAFTRLFRSRAVSDS